AVRATVFDSLRMGTAKCVTMVALGAAILAHSLGAQAALGAGATLMGPSITGTADTSTSELTVGGVRVILRRNTATDVIAANLFRLGGVQQLTPETQGIEAYLLAASERGTKRYPKDALRIATNKMGRVISIEPEDDWTVFGL